MKRLKASIRNVHLSVLITEIKPEIIHALRNEQTIQAAPKLRLTYVYLSVIVYNDAQSPVNQRKCINLNRKTD